MYVFFFFCYRQTRHFITLQPPSLSATDRIMSLSPVTNGLFSKLYIRTSASLNGGNLEHMRNTLAEGVQAHLPLYHSLTL